MLGFHLLYAKVCYHLVDLIAKIIHYLQVPKNAAPIEFKNQKQPEFHNQVAADGYSVDKEKWNVDFKKLKEQADEALNHLQKLEDSLI